MIDFSMVSSSRTMELQPQLLCEFRHELNFEVHFSLNFTAELYYDTAIPFFFPLTLQLRLSMPRLRFILTVHPALFFFIDYALQIVYAMAWIFDYAPCFVYCM